jgi:putative MATE family efflux protein
LTVSALAAYTAIVRFPEPSMTAAAALPASPLLAAPIVGSIARLAAPTMAVMVAQAAVSIAETAIIGRLGTEALAGFALVFPLMMLMTMMAAGGIGGGIAGAVARALGGGRREEAGALVPHALLIATAFAAIFTVSMWLAGPTIFRALGGSGAALEHAIAYSHVLFLGAVAHWMMFALSAALRGTGNAALPGKAMLLSSLTQIPLSFVLVLGIGSWPGLGIVGAAISSITTAGAAALFQWHRMRTGALGFAPVLGALGWRRGLFGAILRVGLLASLSSVVINLTALLVTLLVGGFGVAALAAYGVGARLEFLQVPLVFGIGSALTTLVGVAVGAGDFERARRIAWTGALAAGALTGAIGIFGAATPQAWTGLFSDDPAVHTAGRAYLVHVAPCYVAFGIAMALSFASQGAGRMAIPLVGGILRMLVATIGGWLAVRAGLGLDGLFTMVGAGMLTVGIVTAGGIWLLPWRAAGTRRVPEARR